MSDSEIADIQVVVTNLRNEGKQIAVQKSVQAVMKHFASTIEGLVRVNPSYVKTIVNSKGSTYHGFVAYDLPTDRGSFTDVSVQYAAFYHSNITMAEIAQFARQWNSRGITFSLIVANNKIAGLDVSYYDPSLPDRLFQAFSFIQKGVATSSIGISGTYAVNASLNLVGLYQYLEHVLEVLDRNGNIRAPHELFLGALSKIIQAGSAFIQQ